jgi:hypothetical protein
MSGKAQKMSEKARPTSEKAQKALTGSLGNDAKTVVSFMATIG